MSIQKLTQIGKDLSVAGATGMRKQDLIFQILKAQAEDAVAQNAGSQVLTGAGVAMPLLCTGGTTKVARDSDLASGLP